MENFVNINGCKIAYSDVGSGPVIVFLHGWMASKKVYEGLVEILSKKYRCTSIDVPGFGNSGLAKNPTVNKIPILLHKLLKKLIAGKYYLVGNSFGGAISIMYAKRYSDNIIKLVLISPFVDFKQFSRLIYFLLTYVIPHIIDKGIISPIFRIITAFVNYNFKKDSGDNLMEMRKRSRIKRRAIYSFKIAYELSSLDLYPVLRGIRKDILLVYGSRDSLLSIRPLQPLFGALNNIHLAIFEDIRHYVYSYDSNDLAEKIDLFFKSGSVK